MLKGIRSAATASWHTQLPPMHTQTLCPHSNLASGATRYFSTQLRLLKEIGSSPEKSRPVSRSRDSPSRTQRGPISTGTLRKTVMEEVAIPGKYQMYFKPDKRATRKLEGDAKVERTRSTKKVAAAKWRKDRHDEEKDSSTSLSSTSSSSTSSSSTSSSSPSSLDPSTGASSRPKGFDNVAWRALEQVYAREVLPHPYLHRDYLDITEIKLLEDRKTFQLWYRPKPNDLVTSDQIAEALSKHVHALKAMLARHARQTTSSRLVFQFVRQSDRQAEMDSIWRKLEAEVGRVVEEGKGTDVK